MLNDIRGVRVRCNSVRCNKSNDAPCLRADLAHTTSLCEVCIPSMSKPKSKIMLIQIGYTEGTV